MVYYPLSTLMLANIREILLISTNDHIGNFERTLGDGNSLGVSITYKTQLSPKGIADSIIIGENFIGKDSFALILGDNIFHGQGLGEQLKNLGDPEGAHIFVSRVSNPKEYGVAEINRLGEVVSLEEKPLNPKSNFAVTGFYLYNNSAIDFAKSVTPSTRGELEITSLNEKYLDKKLLKTTVLERGTAWMDAGTFEALFAASAYVRSVEERQGLKIACLEEIAWRNGWITDSQLYQIALGLKNEESTSYLLNVLKFSNS